MLTETEPTGVEGWFGLVGFSDIELLLGFIHFNILLPSHYNWPFSFGHKSQDNVG